MARTGSRYGGDVAGRPSRLAPLATSWNSLVREKSRKPCTSHFRRYLTAVYLISFNHLKFLKRKFRAHLTPQCDQRSSRVQHLFLNLLVLHSWSSQSSQSYRCRNAVRESIVRSINQPCLITMSTSESFLADVLTRCPRWGLERPRFETFHCCKIAIDHSPPLLYGRQNNEHGATRKEEFCQGKYALLQKKRGRQFWSSEVF